jgi:thiol-disulfide isomerase/thioredoxin
VGGVARGGNSAVGEDAEAEGGECLANIDDWLEPEKPWSAVGLTRDPHEVPSPLINKAAPTFRLPQLKDPSKTFSAEDMRGKVWILNVWASWCVSCRDEHPLLIEYSKKGVVPIYGLNWKDQREDALRWHRPVDRALLLCRCG